MIEFNAQGSRDGVVRAINEFKTNPPTEDQAQIQAVRLFVESEVEALPKKFNGANVRITGSFNETIRQVTIVINGSELHL